jgi:hypothetical protein
LLTYDENLIKAAQAEGIKVVDGNHLVSDILEKELKIAQRWVP